MLRSGVRAAEIRPGHRKRFKTLAQLGHLSKHDERSSRACLYGKLFVALLTQKLIRVGHAISPWGYNLQPTSQPLA